MKLLTFLRTPKLRTRFRIFSDLRSSTRLWFLYASASLGLLKVLRTPTSRDELVRKLAIQRPELLDSLLALGTALKELRATPDGLYRIAGNCSSALASDEEDVLAANIEEFTTIHSSAFQNLIPRMRGAPLGDYLKGSGPLIARSSRITEPFLREFVKRVIREVKPGRMLEVGCGSGIYMKYAAEARKQLVGVGIDLQEGVANEAASNLRSWGLDERFEVRVGDARSLPPALQGPFDLITLYNNIYYFPVEERVSLFRELRSKLSRGGGISIASLMHGKNLTACEFDLVLRSTVGLTPLPELSQTKKQLADAGFTTVEATNLIPFESYYGIIAR